MQRFYRTALADITEQTAEKSAAFLCYIDVQTVYGMPVSVEGAVICFVVVRSYGDRSPCIAAEINIGTKLCIQTVSSVVYRIGEPCKLCRRADQIGILFRTGAGGLNL